MVRYLAVLAISFVALAFCHWPPAGAVTLELEIESQGEPIPEASISFETPAGEPVPLTELVSVEDPQTSSTADETVNEAEQDTARETDGDSQQTAIETSQDETATNGESDTPQPLVTDLAGEAVAEIPDTLVGTDVVVVLKKDDQVVKRQTVSVGEDSGPLTIEAYDPADASLSIEIAQPSICSRGQECGFLFKVNNGGTGIYTGPIFFSGSLPGAPPPMKADDDAKQDDETGQDNETTQSVLCSSSGTGRQFCHVPASVEPGATAEYTLSVELLGQISKNASACLEFVRFDADGDQLVQALQHGLAARGLNPGRADGRAGPKTNRAVEQFLQDSARADSPEHAELVTMLYGYDVDRVARLGLDQAKGCTSLNLKPEPKPVATKKQTPAKEQKSKSTSKSTSKTTSKTSRTDKAKRILKNPAVQFGIGAGINSLQKGGGSRSRGQSKRREW